MRIVEDYDAKILFFEMLEAVKNGETVAIAHHGQVVGYLCPAPHPPLSQETDWSVLRPGGTSSDEGCGDLPEHLAPVSDNLRDLLDWRRYGRR